MNAKTQATIYAQALYNVLADKKGKALDDVVENFVAVLKLNHKMHLMSDILSELQKIHFVKTDKVAAKVVSKEKLDSAILGKIKSLVKSNTDKSPEIVEEIDNTLLGGVAIKYQDKIVDLTLDSQLKNLSKQLIK